VVAIRVPLRVLIIFPMYTEELRDLDHNAKYSINGTHYMATEIHAS